jgi:hypothetical protein
MILVAVLLFLALMIFGWKSEADDSGVSLKLLSRFTLARVPYGEIEKAERVDWKRALWLNMGSFTGRRQWTWGGRLFGDRIVIYRRDGTLFLIAPRDPDRFLRELEKRRSKPA